MKNSFCIDLQRFMRIPTKFLLSLLLFLDNSRKEHKKSSGYISVIRAFIYYKRRRSPTLPHCIAVPSAQTGLTSLFGMVRGGTPSQ